MTIEESAKKFVTLADEPTLSKAEHEEVRELMRQLKKSGMSNEEISELSKGKWTSSTIKFYTPGIKSAQPSSWQNTVSLLDGLISAHMTLDDVETAVSLRADLNSSGVSLDRMAELMCAADDASIDLTDLIKQYEEFKKLGISPGNAAEALNLKKELEETGLGLGSLAPLVELARKHGEPQQIIQALSKFGSLGELMEQVDSARHELENLNQQVEEAKTELNQLLKPVEAFEKAVKSGFGEQQLDRLSGLAEKYGGANEVLTAVEAYTSHADISTKAAQVKTDLAELQVKISNLETQYGYLKTATTMCDDLIQNYGFGLDAIATIVSIAKKYGEPLNVLKAIELYGQAKELEQKKLNLEGSVSQLGKELAKIEGQYSEALKELDSLRSLVLNIGSDIGTLQGRLEGSSELLKLLNLIDSPGAAVYGDYINTALLTSVALRKWVSANEGKFKSAYDIKNGLKALANELGGFE